MRAPWARTRRVQDRREKESMRRGRERWTTIGRQTEEILQQNKFSSMVDGGASGRQFGTDKTRWGWGWGWGWDIAHGGVSDGRMRMRLERK